jgi:hypothetical protein
MNHDYLLGAWKERKEVINAIAPVTDWTFEGK